jgi:aryl-alcohol dehydrogenase-like predicted oxidoreductase
MAESAPPELRINTKETAMNASDLLLATDPGERNGDMLYRTLGSTGERVSLIGFGGFHIGVSSVADSEAIRLIRQAIDRGITFLDNSWDYNDGRSEELMGRALSEGGYRDKVYLMTKIDGRTKEEAAKQLETSLKRLKTDRIDLVQHHEILRFEDPDRVFDEGGANEALVEAKQAGKLRYIGFTGHKDPRIHLYMLEVAARRGFHIDTVQMPLNVMDAHYRSFAHEVLPVLVEQKLGVLGMKSLAGGIIPKSGAPVTAIDCLHYAMNQPTSVVITGIDSQQVLDQAFEAARTFRPMGKGELAALLEKTKPQAAEGRYELFKTTAAFDATSTHPEWLGEQPRRVNELQPAGL